MMRPPSDDDTGSDPAAYARKVVQESGITAPPVSEWRITEHLGLELKEFWPAQTSGEGAPSEIHQHVLGWLQHRPGRRARIWVRGDISRERRRMTIFHECGHAILPWHQELDYMCAASDLRSNAQKECEREAFACGCELMMPANMFVPHALYFDAAFRSPCVTGLNLLSGHYQASLEATAIRYAELHPSPRAVLIVEQVGNETSGRYDLRVRYCVKSQRFPGYIPAGHIIDKDSLVHNAMDCTFPIEGEMPGSVLGSTCTLTYRAACRPFSHRGIALVLLWLPE